MSVVESVSGGEGSSVGGESLYSREYRRLRSLTSTNEIQRQCVSEGGGGFMY